MCCVLKNARTRLQLAKVSFVSFTSDHEHRVVMRFPHNRKRIKQQLQPFLSIDSRKKQDYAAIVQLLGGVDEIRRINKLMGFKRQRNDRGTVVSQVRAEPNGLVAFGLRSVMN